MQITSHEPTEANGITYKRTDVQIGKTTYQITVATGRTNYVNVFKTGGPWATLGKQYPTFDDAVAAYKNANLKTALLRIELGV